MNGEANRAQIEEVYLVYLMPRVRETVSGHF